MNKRKILIVDDNLNYIQLLSILLESRGLEVTISGDPAKALELIQKSRFDMVITDFNMPGMTGIRFAAEARVHSPGVQIIMITGGFFPGIVESAAHAGISRVLEKPVNVTQLMSIIRSSCTSSSPARRRQGAQASTRKGESL